MKVHQIRSRFQSRHQTPCMRLRKMTRRGQDTGSSAGRSIRQEMERSIRKVTRSGSDTLDEETNKLYAQWEIEIKPPTGLATETMPFVWMLVLAGMTVVLESTERKKDR